MPAKPTPARDAGGVGQASGSSQTGVPRITPGNGVTTGTHDGADGSTALSCEQRLELYYYMRLTRSLEERLVNL
jgi:hypothetical protein